MAKKRKRAWTPGQFKKLRARMYGESQARFARRLNVSTKAVSSYEQGVRPIRGPLVRLLDMLEAAAEAGSPLPHPDDEALALVGC